MGFQPQQVAYWLYRPSEACLSQELLLLWLWRREYLPLGSSLYQALPCLNLSCTELNAAEKMPLPGLGLLCHRVSASGPEKSKWRCCVWCFDAVEAPCWGEQKWACYVKVLPGGI